ncbi:hypothetical protein BDV12DRAFT_205246 [Aspergillus spectabilis]
MSDEQLDDLLKQPFDKPIFWQNYTQHYPLHGVHNSIPDFLAELHQLDIKSLEAHDYAKNKNHSVYLDDIAEHFQKPPMFSSPLNFLEPIILLPVQYYDSAVPYMTTLLSRRN